MDQLEFFKNFHPIAEDDYALLISNFKSKTFQKSEIIISPGQTQRELYFVKSGVQMSYYETETKTHVIAFTYPPNICAIPESFLFQTPSQYTLTCLTNSEMDYISFNTLQSLFDKSQALERLFRKMTEFVLAGTINRHIELHSLTMEQRYKSFCKRSAHLLQTIPHKYIASYLDIDPTNFRKLFNQVKI
jgi:CRP-like cAMP-binding protein